MNERAIKSKINRQLRRAEDAPAAMEARMLAQKAQIEAARRVEGLYPFPAWCSGCVSPTCESCRYYGVTPPTAELEKAAEERAFYVAHEVGEAIKRGHFWPLDRNAYDESTGRAFTKADAVYAAKMRAGTEWDYAHGLIVLDARGNVVEAHGVSPTAELGQ